MVINDFRLPRPGKEEKPLGSALIVERADSCRAIFVHVHKCAGTSLISQLSMKSEVLSCAARPGDYPGRSGREYFPDSLWSNSFKFSFVRDPHSRTLSAYLMFRKNRMWRRLFPDFASFVEMLRWVDLDSHKVDSTIPLDMYLKTLDNVWHHCSSFANPKYMLGEADYVGRVENINSDLKTVGEMIGIELEAPRRLNVTSADSQMDAYYTDRLKRLVRSIYASDFDRYGY